MIDSQIKSKTLYSVPSYLHYSIEGEKRDPQKNPSHWFWFIYRLVAQCVVQPEIVWCVIEIPAPGINQIFSKLFGVISYYVMI